MVLNGLESGTDPADYAAHGLAPVIGGLERGAGALVRLRRATWQCPSPCAVHLDTGMNRLGFESLAQLLERRWRRMALRAELIR